MVGSSAVEGAILLDFGLKTMFHLKDMDLTEPMTKLTVKLKTLFRWKVSLNYRLICGVVLLAS